MRNLDLPKLLREYGSGHTKCYGNSHLEKMLEQAAIELEKLEKIYKLIDDKDYDFVQVIEILQEAP